MSDALVTAGAGRTSRRVAWRPEQWPEADQEAWTRARTPAGLLDDGGDAADWRPATIRAAVGAYGRFLAFLEAQGLLDREGAPADRLTPFVLDRYVAKLRETCAPVTVASYVATLSMMVQVLAPGKDWNWVWHAHRRLKRRAEPIRNKRARVVPAADLLALGDELMRQARTEDMPDKERLLRFRDGLMIAMLICRPVRLSNFLHIRIGHELVQAGNGWALCFDKDATKDGRAHHFPCPPELRPALEHYLHTVRHTVRPALLALGRKRFPHRHMQDAGQHLWVTIDGTPCTPGSLEKMLEKRTISRFGRCINAHLFRDCAATSVVTEAPEHVRIAAQVLGHATLQTAERHYIVANTRWEVRRYQQGILALRHQGM
jgi:integrase/recombinase XerD